MTTSHTHNPPGARSPQEIGLMFLAGLAKIALAVVAFAIFTIIAAVAGLTVSGFGCSGGVLGEGCSSDNATGGWIVFGVVTTLGGLLGILIMLPKSWRRALFHAKKS